MARQLKNIRIHEVSAVDRGAGEGVRVMLVKRKSPLELVGKDGAKILPFVRKDFDEAIDDLHVGDDLGALLKELNDAYYALQRCVGEIMNDADDSDKEGSIRDSYSQFIDYVGGLQKSYMEKATMPTEAEKQAQEKIVAEMVAKRQKKVAKKAKRVEIEKAMLPSESAFYTALVGKGDRKAFRKMTAAQRAEVVKAKKMPPKAKTDQGAKDDNDDDDKAQKSFVSDELAKRDTAIADLTKRNAALEDAATLTICKADAKEMGLDGDDAGDILMKARKGDPAGVKKLEAALKQLRMQRDQAVETGGLFKEMGTALGGATGADAYSQLMAKAAELKKADGKLTIEQAFAKVVEDPANTALVALEKTERMAKIHRAA